MRKDLNGHLAKEDVLRANSSIWKDVYYHMSLENYMLKQWWDTTMHQIGWLESEALTSPNVGKDRKPKELSFTAAAAAKPLQSCPTLCDPIDGSPSGSPVPGILKARTLEWVAISFSNACKWRVKVKSLSHVLLLATPWIAAHQAPPSMGFSRQEYWSGVPLPSLYILIFC